MDTDSNYMAISGERLEDIVRPELREEFEARKKRWLTWEKWSGRAPGLFKLKCEGVRMIALCSKCYYIEKSEGETWEKWSGRAPGLFKLKCEGVRMIALCSKCYYIEKSEGDKKKFTRKGMSKKRNEIMWQRFTAALEGSKDMAINRGFRMRDGGMVPYEQQNLGLSAYYDNPWVLPDRVHTEPIEFKI